jgi:hypothetical protein
MAEHEHEGGNPAMGKKVCPLCKQEVDQELIELHTGREKMIIQLIKEKNPDWVEETGACPRCIEYYRSIESN